MIELRKQCNHGELWPHSATGSNQHEVRWCHPPQPSSLEVIEWLRRRGLALPIDWCSTCGVSWKNHQSGVYEYRQNDCVRTTAYIVEEKTSADDAL